MPLFEYTCNQCRKRFSVLVGMTSDGDSGVCPHCGSDQSTKRVTRFAAVRGDVDVDADPDDPKAMRRWAREMGSEMGENLGDDFDEYLDAAEAGELLDDG